MTDIYPPPLASPGAGIGVEDFAFPTQTYSSPQSLRQTRRTGDVFSSSPVGHERDHDYNFSNELDDVSADVSAAENDELHTDEDEDEGVVEDAAVIGDRSVLEEDDEDEADVSHLSVPLERECASARTSISSLPHSVLHHEQEAQLHQTLNGDEILRTPSKSPPALFLQNHFQPLSPANAGRGYGSGFRNPSSVRAMQMRDEMIGDDSDSLETPRHRRRGSRMSVFSEHRSSSKRGLSSRSNHSLSQKPNSNSKLKKEFPLVLLHCSLLTPALSVHAALLADTVVEEVLPEEYRKRWRTLQDKVMRNSEVWSRGVLIPHPKEDFELLEERLLESLELERPRIRKGHFLPSDRASADSGFESSSQTDETDDEIEDTKTGTKCPDCRKKIFLDDGEIERLWEVKVYAANGLMRAGAWGAAWQEMEKIDVEVSVWMPEDLRRRVDATIAELGAHESSERERGHENLTEHDARHREIYGDAAVPQRRQEDIDGLFEEKVDRGRRRKSIKTASQPREPSLRSLVLDYVQVLAQDKRKITIFLLSILVLFYATATSAYTARTTLPITNSSGADITSIPVMEFVTSTSTVISLSTSIATTTVISSVTVEQEQSSFLDVLPTSLTGKAPVPSMAVEEESTVLPLQLPDVEEVVFGKD